MDATRYLIEVVTSSGRAAAVEFRIGSDSVEVWCENHCSAVIDRELLRSWLAAPWDPLAVDEVTFSLDRLVDQDGRIALTLPVVRAWTLSPREQESLVNRI